MKMSRSIRPLALACSLVFIVVAVLAKVDRARAEKTKVTPSGGGLTGGWAGCETVTDSRTEGDNELTTVTLTQRFEGPIEGTCEGTEKETIHKDGTRTFAGSGLFTGKINGRSGTVLMTHTGTISSEGVTVADWILDHGTDELARIDGHGRSEGKRADGGEGCSDSAAQTAWTGKYSGRIDFSL